MTSEPHDHGHDSHAHAGMTQYIAVFMALVVLTGASFFTYSRFWPWHDQPQVGWAFMMAVSCTKAMLVVLFFMHVKYEASWKYVLTVPCCFMAVFLVLALVPDVGCRANGLFYGWGFTEERKKFVATEQNYRDLIAAAQAKAAAGHAEHGDADHAVETPTAEPHGSGAPAATTDEHAEPAADEAQATEAPAAAE